MRRTDFKVKLDSLNTEVPFQTVWRRNNQPLIYPPNCLCNVLRLRWPKLCEQVWLVWLHSERGPATAQEQARTQPRQPPPPRSCASRRECTLCNSEGAMNQHQSVRCWRRQGVPQKTTSGRLVRRYWLPAQKWAHRWSSSKAPAAFFRVRDNFGLSDPIRTLSKRCVNALTTTPSPPPNPARVVYSAAEAMLPFSPSDVLLSQQQQQTTTDPLSPENAWLTARNDLYFRTGRSGVKYFNAVC